MVPVIYKIYKMFHAGCKYFKYIISNTSISLASGYINLYFTKRKWGLGKA